MVSLQLLALPPKNILLDSAIAILIGLILFLITTLRRLTWSSFREFLSDLQWRNILKDIGMGFLVAGIVSAVYEWNTRSAAEREKGVEVVNNLMSSFTGQNVWEEIRDETIRVPKLRRNIKIRLHFLKDWTLPNGQKVLLPKYQTILWMEFGYDLYLVASEGNQFPVQHALNYEMWNEELQLPRFERVRVITPINPFQSREDVYEGARLKEIYDGKGSIKLQGKYEVNLPPPEENRPVRIITERYEIVNTPGQYSLTMGTLCARDPNSEEHTITVYMDHIDGIEPEVTTYWRGHQFKPNNDKTIWTFDGIMLPGQGFNIVFNVSPDQAVSAQSHSN